MTGPVRPPSRADQAWADLAAQLTPASSLARIDTVTARAITTITRPHHHALTRASSDRLTARKLTRASGNLTGALTAERASSPAPGHPY